MLALLNLLLDGTRVCGLGDVREPVFLFLLLCGALQKVIGREIRSPNLRLELAVDVLLLKCKLKEES